MSDVIQCRIINLKIFCMVLDCITRFVPGGKIVINKDGMLIYTKTTISRIKMFSTCCTSEEEIVLTFNDIKKFIVLLNSILRNSNGNNSIILEYFKAKHVISYDSDELRFRLCCVKEEIITQYIDTAIKVQLIPAIIFDVNFRNLSELLTNCTTLIDTQIIKFRVLQDETKPKMIMIESLVGDNTLSNYLKAVLGITKTSESVSCLPLIIDSERLNMISQLDKYSKTNSATCIIHTNNIIEYCIDINYETKNDIVTTLQIFTSSVKE